MAATSLTFSATTQVADHILDVLAIEEHFRLSIFMIGMEFQAHMRQCLIHSFGKCLQST